MTIKILQLHKSDNVSVFGSGRAKLTLGPKKNCLIVQRWLVLSWVGESEKLKYYKQDNLQYKILSLYIKKKKKKKIN